MHAVVISEPGGPEVLQWIEVEDPRQRRLDLAVEVAAATDPGPPRSRPLRPRSGSSPPSRSPEGWWLLPTTLPAAWLRTTSGFLLNNRKGLRP